MDNYARLVTKSNMNSIKRCKRFNLLESVQMGKVVTDSTNILNLVTASLQEKIVLLKVHRVKLVQRVKRCPRPVWE